MSTETKTPTCDKCGSANLMEQAGDIFPGLLLCQEPGCLGCFLTEAGVANFEEALSEAYIAQMMRVSGNN